MISTLYLQAEIGAAIVAAFFVAIIISIIFYVIQRRSIKDQTIEKLTGKIFQSVPHREEITNLQESLAQFKEEMDEKMEKGEKQNVEIIEALKKQTESDIKSDVTEFAKQQITENTVGREEFDQLEQKINNYLGSEENVEKIKILEKIFDSDKLKTLNWQCDLINLLKQGIAPEIQGELLRSKGIPSSAFGKFLSKLASMNFITSQNVDSYHLDEDSWWVLDYTKNPHDLKNMIESLVIKEKQYQEYVQKNLEIIEEGLRLIQAEYRLPSGPIDFLCIDKEGVKVGLELKYPQATKKDCRQLDGYKKEYLAESPSEKFRGILVSPVLSDTTKNLLKKYGLEWRELPIEENQSQETQNSNDENDKDSEESNELQYWKSRGVLPKGFKAEK